MNKTLTFLLALMLFVFLASPAAAGWHTTRGGYVAATTEKLLDRAVSLAASGDEAAFQSFVKSNPGVIWLKGGLRVYLEETTWTGKVKIRPKGTPISIWTVTEAIK